MSKRRQYDYAVLNQAVYSNNPGGVLKKYGLYTDYDILDITTNYLIVKDSRNGKINFVVKGTDIGNVKGMRLEDLKEDLHIVLNKPETMSRLKSQKSIAKNLVKKYGRNNVVISGHSLGGYIAADIANDLDLKAVVFNIGSSPKKLIPAFNKNIVHYTTNDLSMGIIDPLSVTSATRDFYDKIKVKPKEGVGSGIIRYHTIEHFLPDITDREEKEKTQKYNLSNNKEIEMDFEKRRDRTERILKSTDLTRAQLEDLTDAEIKRMSKNVKKGIRADTGIEKRMGSMNTGELQELAKKYGIKNPKKYKKRNKDKNTLEDLKNLIREKSDESGTEADVDEEEMKFDKEGEEVPARGYERRERRKEVAESAYATLEKLRLEKASRRVAERLSSEEKREAAKTGAMSSTAQKLIREEAEIVKEKMRESRERELKAEKRIDEDLIDTSIYRNMGATPAQKILDQIADDRTNRQIAKDAAKRGYDTAKYLGSSSSAKDLEKRLSEKGVPVEKIKEYKAVYDKVNKNITEKKLDDGSWFTDSVSALGAPEVKVYNEMVKLLGVDLSPKDREEVRDLINGDYKGSTGNAVKVIGQALLSPDGWGVMIETAAKKRAKRVYNDFTDIWSKDDVYEERKKSEKDIRGLIEERKKKEKGDIDEAKELARLRGEDYKGPEYRESEQFNKSLGGPKLSDYGGQDDYSGWEKVGKFFLDAGVAVAEEIFDPLGFIDIATGKPTPKLLKLEQRLKEEDPGAYAQYKRALDEHVKTLRKASVEDKNQEMIIDHKPVAKQLGAIMSSVLEENAKRLREGKEPLISRDRVEKYLNYSKLLKSGKVSYHQLAQIDYMFNSDMEGELPENLNDKYVQWQLEEENQLGKKGAGDSELSITHDTEAYDQVAQIEEARKAEKQAQEQAIKASQEAYEMIRQEEIDAENEETLRKRKDVIHQGFVETKTNKPELRPKIVFGNTDAQYMQSAQEVKEEKELLNRMLMWKAGNMTEQNDPSSILYKRYKENEDLRYGKTYAMPKPRPRDNNIPQQFLVYNERIWVPQNADKAESLPMLRQPERAEAVFDRFEDYRADTTSMREQIANRRNIFPEPHLQGYKGQAISQRGLKGFDRLRNNRYLGY